MTACFVCVRARFPYITNKTLLLLCRTHTYDNILISFLFLFFPIDFFTERIRRAPTRRTIYDDDALTAGHVILMFIKQTCDVADNYYKYNNNK